ncbi:MAG: c-type cytochrome [Bacteroidota bacterium]
MHRTTILFLLAIISLSVISCNSHKQSSEEKTSIDTTTNLMKQAEMMTGDNKGIGQYKDVPLTHPLDEAMLVKGQPLYEAKCFACHKLTDEKLVGPGWKGVTERRTPEWIMNFITNTDVMIDSDLVAQKMFVTCLVRMPSQGVTGDEARSILEFMRKNDGQK